MGDTYVEKKWYVVGTYIWDSIVQVMDGVFYGTTLEGAYIMYILICFKCIRFIQLTELEL